MESKTLGVCVRKEVSTMKLLSRDNGLARRENLGQSRFAIDGGDVG